MFSTENVFSIERVHSLNREHVLYRHERTERGEDDLESGGNQVKLELDTAHIVSKDS